MTDHDDGRFEGDLDLLQPRDEGFHLALRESGGGLVQKHHVRLEREDAADLREAAQPGRELGHRTRSPRREADLIEHLVGSNVLASLG